MGSATEYGKLVRDKIPDIIESNGDICISSVLPENAYKAALHEKLYEEADELLAAKQEDRLGELADIFEVLLAIAEADGYSKNDLFSAASQKRQSRGGFKNRIWLERTETPS